MKQGNELYSNLQVFDTPEEASSTQTFSRGTLKIVRSPLANAPCSESTMPAVAELGLAGLIVVIQILT